MPRTSCLSSWSFCIWVTQSLEQKLLQAYYTEFSIILLWKIEWCLLSKQPHFLWTCYCMTLFSWPVDCLQFLHLAKNISHCSLFFNSPFLIPHPPPPPCLIVPFPQSLIYFHLLSDFYSFSLTLHYPFSHLPHFSNPVLCLSLVLNYTFLQRSILPLCICLFSFSSFADHTSPGMHSTTCFWICHVEAKAVSALSELTNLQTLFTSQLADQLSIVNGNDLHISPATWDVCQYHVNWY